MKKTILIFILVCASLFLKAQDSSPKLVIIRIFDCSDAIIKSILPGIHITEDNGNQRVIEFEKFESRNNQATYFPANNDNLKKLHLELKKYLDEGYEIVGHTKNMWSPEQIYEDYVLVKK